jgi:hypothetical protein
MTPTDLEILKNSVEGLRSDLNKWSDDQRMFQLTHMKPGEMEQGRVKHAGIFAALEDEMCDFGVSGLSGGRSSDRVDALVWAIGALAFQARGGPRIRAL